MSLASYACLKLLTLTWGHSAGRLSGGGTVAFESR
jgi:hypothetical protein